MGERFTSGQTFPLLEFQLPRAAELPAAGSLPGVEERAVPGGREGCVDVRKLDQAKSRQRTTVFTD